jgi:hypothetical protein
MAGRGLLLVVLWNETMAVTFPDQSHWCPQPHPDPNSEEVVQVLTELSLATPDEPRAGHLLSDHPTAGHEGNRSRSEPTHSANAASSRRHPESDWSSAYKDRTPAERLLDEVFARFEEWM